MKYLVLVLAFIALVASAAELYPASEANRTAVKVMEKRIHNDPAMQDTIKMIKDAVQAGKLRVEATIPADKADFFIDYLWNLGYNITDRNPAGDLIKFKVEWR